jgi:hypothetical protein
VVVFLGLEITAHGYRPQQSIVPRLDAIVTPKDKKEVQKFVGILNYYRTHVPALAQIAQPLYDLIPKGVKFVWAEKHEKAFQELKRLVKRGWF